MANKDNIFKRFWVDLKLVGRIVNHFVLQTKYLYLATALFVAILFLLQWLFSLDQLEFLWSSSLSVVEKIDFLIDGFLNIFKFADDIVPVSLILISAMQALAISLLVVLSKELKQIKKTKIKSQASSFTLGLVGAGCVACGGSMLTPILGIIASSVSITLAERIGDILLMFAMVLSYRALSKISYQVAALNIK